MSRPSDLVQGTLDLLLLKILALEPLNGWAISQRLKQVSGDVLQVSDGSLYPALHKLEQEGWITAEWKPSENNRRAKFYSLTRLGRGQLREGNGKLDATLRTPSPRSCGSRRHEPCASNTGSTPCPLRLRSLFRRRHVEQDLDEELQYHLEQKIEEYLAQGLTPEQARARRPARHGRADAAQRGVPRHAQGQPNREYSFRISVTRCASWRSRPGFTAVAVLTLALAIGANSVVFGVLNAPDPTPARTCRRRRASTESSARTIISRRESYPDYLDMRDRNRSFEGLAAYAIDAGRAGHGRQSIPRLARDGERELLRRTRASSRISAVSSTPPMSTARTARPISCSRTDTGTPIFRTTPASWAVSSG